MNFVKKLTILIITIILCLPPMGAFAATVPKLDTTDVMDDLKGLKIGGVEFDEANYPLKNGSEPVLLGIYESGWGTEFYTLYVYIYNPDADNYNSDYSTSFRNFFHGSLYAHKDSLDNQYLRISLDGASLVDTVDISSDGRFIKLKIDPSGLVDYFKDAHSRIYSVMITTWYTQISDNADHTGNYPEEVKEIDIGGYGDFYSFNVNGTATYQDGKTISLTVNPSMYKTDFSPKGDYWHQMIYTAYFTIPKEYKDDYDAICGVEATWEEYHTAPLVVTNNDSLFSILQNMANDSNVDSKLQMGQVDHNYGAVISQYGCLPNSFGESYYGSLSINLIGLNDNYRTDIFKIGFSDIVNFSTDRFNSFDTVLKVSDIYNFYIPTVGRYYDSDGDGRGDIPASFNYSVDEGRLLGKNTYSFTCKDILDINNRFTSGWGKFWSGILYSDSNDISVELDPFYYLKDSDMIGYSRSKVNESLFIGEEFWDDFYDTYTSAKLKGDQVVLFRYALRDYYSAPARYIDSSTYDYRSLSPNCALSYGTAFLDFDIIKLSFNKDSVIYDFKVDADPVDFVPGGYSPNIPGAGVGDGLHDLLDAIYAAVKVVCVVAAIIVVVVVLDKTTAIFDRLFGRRRR